MDGTPQEKILYRELNTELAAENPDFSKVDEIKNQLKSRGHNVTEIQITIDRRKSETRDPDSESDQHEPFEDEGASDDDFID